MTHQMDQLKRATWKGKTAGTSGSYGSFMLFIIEKEYFPGAWQDQKKKKKKYCLLAGWFFRFCAQLLTTT